MARVTTASDLDGQDFSSQIGLNARIIDFRYRELAAYFQGKSCLEFGCADGRGLDVLLSCFEEVTAIDGSKKRLDEVRTRFPSPKLTLVHSLFEELALGRSFDTVQMGHILEHVDDPAAVIRVGMKHLAREGVLIADVPNAQSIHRHIGVALGMIKQVTDLNEADHQIGHQRVYTPETFRKEIEGCGLTVVKAGGIFMKPLSNGQMESMLNDAQINAFFEVGKQFPEIAAEIYVIARR